MSQLNILIVEDEKEWRDDLEEAILTFWDASAKVNAVADPNAVADLLDKNAYDMAIIDLSLSGTPAGQSGSDKAGMSLLRQIRQHPRNHCCVIVIYSGYSENEIQREAERVLGADAYLIKAVDKENFDAEKFVGWCKEELLDGRLKRAMDSAGSYNRLTFKFNQTGITGYELSGPGLRRTALLNLPAEFNSDDLTRRGDNLNRYILTDGPEVWRPEADSIGRDIDRVLSDNRLLDDLSAAQASGVKKVWLAFSGPAQILGVPFELWQNAGSYLCRRHPLTRRYDISDIAQNTLTFRRFLDETARNGRLRVLVVGSNSDGNIPAVDEEAELVAETISQETKQLGLSCGVRLLKSEQADYETVCEELKNGGYHIFHYAGHGRHNDKLPEIGGLVLKDGAAQAPGSGSLQKLDARVLNQLIVRGRTTLQLIFLSCCLGARTSRQPSHGEFHGTLEALASAGVPTILGYRWTVRDDSALAMAQAFYQNLWRTFSPAEALLEARTELVVKHGLDDETWASPILLDQSA